MLIGKLASRLVVTTSPGTSVLEASRLMAERNVGTVIVLGPTRRPLGIVTDRDVVIRCVSRTLDPAATPVSEVMTSEVLTIDESAEVDEALGEMKLAGVRRIVVIRASGEAVGVLAMDDVLRLLAQETAAIMSILEREGADLLTTP